MSLLLPNLQKINGKDTAATYAQAQSLSRELTSRVRLGDTGWGSCLPVDRQPSALGPRKACPLGVQAAGPGGKLSVCPSWGHRREAPFLSPDPHRAAPGHSPLGEVCG